MKVDQGSLTLPQNILLNPEDHQKIIEAYFVYVSESAKAIRNALGSADVIDEQIDSDVRDLSLRVVLVLLEGIKVKCGCVCRRGGV